MRISDWSSDVCSSDLAADLSVPLVPQGGNTSMVGGATPPADGSALILSLRRMNHIRSLSPDDNLAVCEAGVILSNLHDAAAAETAAVAIAWACELFTTTRSEERRVGKECVSTCRSRWSTYP